MSSIRFLLEAGLAMLSMAKIIIKLMNRPLLIEYNSKLFLHLLKHIGLKNNAQFTDAQCLVYEADLHYPHVVYEEYNCFFIVHSFNFISM